MTATSGPGFSLMQEAIGYAIMVEAPLVIVNVMRVGPSTGSPDRSVQGDVMQARWGTHGDHPAIVLAASNVADMYRLTMAAVRFAQRFRTPVILLADQIVGQMRESFSPELVGPLPPDERRLRLHARLHHTLRWRASPSRRTCWARAPIPRHRPFPRRDRLPHQRP